jgi:putative DNA primase/helicase
MVLSAQGKKYHEIKDYLNKLVWDGVPRVETWLIDVFGVDDNIYTRAVSKKVLVGAVGRVFDKGVKFDHLMILEGEQGTGKSLLLKHLAGEKFYTNVSFHNTDKEIIEAMRGKWILEFDEMADIRKADVERVKSLLSRSTDRTRLAYGRLAEDYPRQSIMVGTINPRGTNTYLQDDTGNRRFWPIECKGKLKLEKFLGMRDQLFAEAKTLYQSGEPLWLDKDDVMIKAINVQDSRYEEDPWFETIRDYLSRNRLDFITATDILNKCLHLENHQINKFNAARVGTILRKFGWRYTRSHIHGRCFVPPNYEELEDIK